MATHATLRRCASPSLTGSSSLGKASRARSAPRRDRPHARLRKRRLDTTAPVRKHTVMHDAPSREVVACDLCGADDAAFLVAKNGFRVVRCRRCDLVYVNPRPRAAALHAQYSAATYVRHQEERADDLDWRPSARARLALIEQ